MAIVDLLMPKMGESIMEATMLKWHKQAGDAVKQDESLLDIATDKVDTEVPSTTAGTLQEILYQVNDVVPVGAVIARIKTAVTESVTDENNSTAPVNPGTPAAHEERTEEAFIAASSVNQASASDRPVSSQEAPDLSKSNGNGNRFYSPLVLNIAGNEGISASELEKIPGTGNEGRVTKKDILQYVTHKKEGNGTFAGSVGEQTHSGSYENKSFAADESPAYEKSEASAYSGGGHVEIQEMDRMRRLIAEHMVRSKQTSAHVTSFSEADVTNLVLWREKEKADFEKREGTKLTLTPLFIEAVVKCIKKYPFINSSLQGDKIIIRKDIHIGMATALPSGSLIVPVIKHA